MNIYKHIDKNSSSAKRSDYAAERRE